MKRKASRYFKRPQLLYDGVPYPQESSQSICRENRLVGLFMIRAFMMKISKSFGALLFSRLFFKCSQTTSLITNEFR